MGIFTEEERELFVAGCARVEEERLRRGCVAYPGCMCGAGECALKTMQEVAEEFGIGAR